MKQLERILRRLKIERDDWSKSREELIETQEEIEKVEDELYNQQKTLKQWTQQQ